MFAKTDHNKRARESTTLSLDSSLRNNFGPELIVQYPNAAKATALSCLLDILISRAKGPAPLSGANRYIYFTFPETPRFALGVPSDLSYCESLVLPIITTLLSRLQAC